MEEKQIAFLKAKWKLNYELTNLDKLIFRFFGRKIITMDFQWDIWCKITAYWYRWHIAIFNIEYFEAKTSPTI